MTKINLDPLIKNLKVKLNANKIGKKDVSLDYNSASAILLILEHLSEFRGKVK